MRIAAVADLHYSKKPGYGLRKLFQSINESADVLVLPGDLTDHGLAEEAQRLAEDLNKYVHIPVLAVFGNHDFGSEQSDAIRRHLQNDAGVIVLDGDATIIDGVGFAGAPGFAGGFDRWALHAWGERTIRDFVQAALEQSLKLESALSQLVEASHRIVLLHYAPIRQTVEGEPLEIFPFLGSSRLEPPLDHFDVTACFHGHAHRGTLSGHTQRGVPVYNVSLPLLRTHYPERPPYFLFTLDRESEQE